MQLAQHLLSLIALFTSAWAYMGSRFHLSSSDEPKWLHSKDNYETKFFSTEVDHFTFENDLVFNMKYLMSKEHHVNGGPIFFYAGNEGNIETFAENSGFIWELASELQAAVVFAEHRFYGVSMPFGNESFKDYKHFGYLTAEQALADYALLLQSLKTTDPSFQQSPVIAFGGSYGGMLAAWFRQKYPNIIAGSVAASAPVWLFPNMSECDGFNKVVTNSFQTVGSQKCRDNIQKIWDSIVQVAKGPDGLTFLTLTFKLCDHLTSADDLVAYLIDYLGTIAMVNYPYEAEFIGKLPAWPVKVFCQPLSSANDLSDPLDISRFAYALHSLTNYTGQQKCVDIKGDSQGLDINGWYIQTCMEMTVPWCSTGKTDMFPPAGWDPAAFSAACKKTLGVTPRLSWSNVQFWGKDLRTATNILYSNGLLDPWSALGVLKPEQAPHSTVVLIPSGAHHLDLRASNPLDPADVIEARKVEKSTIMKWIAEWKQTTIK